MKNIIKITLAASIVIASSAIATVTVINKTPASYRFRYLVSGTGKEALFEIKPGETVISKVDNDSKGNPRPKNDYWLLDMSTGSGGGHIIKSVPSPAGEGKGNRTITIFTPNPSDIWYDIWEVDFKDEPTK